MENKYKYKYNNTEIKEDNTIRPNYYKMSYKGEPMDVFDLMNIIIPDTSKYTTGEITKIFNIIKYVTRYKDKNGAEDIKKIITYANLLLDEVEAK